MDPQRLARLRALLVSVRPGEWHAGRTVRRTLYDGDGPDDCFGLVDHPFIAELIVLLHEYAREQLLGE